MGKKKLLFTWHKQFLHMLQPKHKFCRVLFFLVPVFFLLSANGAEGTKEQKMLLAGPCWNTNRESLAGCGRLLYEPQADRGQEATEPKLYAKAACLMDMDTGRILYGKNEETELANASTTKIMTLLVLLKYGNLKDEVTISRYASQQPKVRLGVSAGEQFRFEDLCYSLMLESHNDAAYALAEHVGSRLLKCSVTENTTKEESQKYVRRFMEEVNAQAQKMGLRNTHFVTPNGLDGEDEAGEHHSTAADLCRMLCVASKNEVFCKITQTRSCQFSDSRGNHSCTVYNHNQLLERMEGCITGKTGFTSKAGYCYAGAVQIGEKRFAGAVLACGWPPNKGYKWEDMKQLFTYGDSCYQLYEAGEEEEQKFEVPVKNGQEECALLVAHTGKLRLLLSEDEKVKIHIQIPKTLTAPVSSGNIVGRISYELNGETLCEYPVQVVNEIREKNYFFYLRKYADGFLFT